MPKQYYCGRNQHHAAFWVGFRELPQEKHFSAFIKFYRKTEEDVLTSKCALREAGYALEPGEYDEAICPSAPGVYDAQVADMTIALSLASDLAGWVFESQQEAEEDWGQIMLIMGKYIAQQRIDRYG